MWLNVFIGFFCITNICLSLLIVGIVLLQRGEDGAFSRSTVHNIIRTNINTLFSKTWKLIILYIIHTIIFSYIISAQYYNFEKNIQYDTIIIKNKN